MDQLSSDIRHALRALLTQPVFSLVAAISIAIGIGANTAIFSIANALLLRPLPGIAGYERAVEIGRTRDGRGFDSFSYPDFLDVREGATALAEVAGWRDAQMSLAVGGAGERVSAMHVSANYFDALGVQAVVGRTFLPEEDVGPGQHPVAVIGYRFWQDRFGGEEGVLGRTVSLNRIAYTIVGVAPPGFSGHVIGLSQDLWVPLMQHASVVASPARLEQRGNMWFNVIGRLADGATVEQADASVGTVFRTLAERYPETNGRRGAHVVALGPVPGAGRGAVAGFMGVLGTVVGLVLAITCANVSGMLLARSAAREKEIAVRLALGAGRGRLVRYLMTESLLLFAVGGALGAALAVVALRALDVASLSLPVPLTLDISPDLRVFGFTAVVTLVTGAVFGLVPAWQSTRPSLVPALKDEASGGGARRRRLRGVFIGGQVAMSLLLLVTAGLFVRALQRAADIDTGFQPSGVYMASVDLSLEGYDTVEAGVAFFDRILDRLRGTPGVASASLSRDLPLDMGSNGTSVFPEGRDPDDPDSRVPVDFNQVAVDYFQTLRIPLLSGRPFDAADRPGAARVAVVSRAFVDEVYPNEDPLGRQFRFGVSDGSVHTIVGVVEDTKNQMITEARKPFVYFPIAQEYAPEVNVLIRMNADLAAAATVMRRELLAVDPSLSLTPVLSVESYTSIGTLPQRFGASLTSALGMVALLLAGVGVYGVIAFHVSQRKREIGVRMALGAEPGRVVRGVMRTAFGLAAPGLGLGLILAAALGQLMQGFVLGVTALDPVLLGTVGAIMAMVIVLAAIVPARRAAAVSPVEALRSE